MPRYDLSSEAQADLESLRAYIAEQSGALRARSVLVRIRRAFETLAFMPRMGSAKPYLDRGLLAFPVSPWTIIYEPLADGILVMRIVDGRRDLFALFEDDA